MTQRTEARFKVYNTTNTSIVNTIMPYDKIDFNEGGTYDTLSYTYTIENAGLYLIGHSHSKKQSLSTGNPYQGRALLRLTRNGVTYELTRPEMRVRSTANTTISCVTMYKFEVGDIIYIYGSQGQPMMNSSSYSGTDTRNSWWGIKLDY